MAPDSDVETYRRAEADDRQLALGRRAVLPAHRQAHVRRARPRSSIQFKQAPFVMFRDTAVDELPPNIMVLHSSRTKASRCTSAPSSPGQIVELGRVSMNFRYEDYLQAEAVHRLRDADLRRADRRPDAVQARRQHRGRLEGRAADPGRVGQGRRQGAHLRRRHATDRTAADALLSRDGRHWRKLVDLHDPAGRLRRRRHAGHHGQGLTPATIDAAHRLRERHPPRAGQQPAAARHGVPDRWNLRPHRSARRASTAATILAPDGA